jgi:hypothetical protein
MHELEERIREAFESHPDMMGGLLAVYALGKLDATDREVGSHEGHRIEERPTLTSAVVPRVCHTCGVEIEPRTKGA